MKKFLMLVAVLALVAAACGGGSDADDGPSANLVEVPTRVPTAVAGEPAENAGAEPATEDVNSGAEPAVGAADPTPVPEATAIETPSPVPEPTREPAPRAEGMDEAVQAVTEAEDWCAAAAAVEAGTSVMETLDFSNPIRVEQAFNQTLEVVNASKAIVPFEIAEDLDVSIEAFTALAAALEDANWSIFDLDAAILQEFAEPMDIATYNIESYNFNVCDIGDEPAIPGLDFTEPAEEGTDTASAGPIETDDNAGDQEDLTGIDAIRDEIVNGFVEAGFTIEEATCLFDEATVGAASAMTDSEQIVQVFTNCGISLERLGSLGGG